MVMLLNGDGKEDDEYWPTALFIGELSYSYLRLRLI